MKRWKNLWLLSFLILILGGCNIKNTSVTTKNNILERHNGAVLLVYIKEHGLWLSDSDGSNAELLQTVGQDIVGVVWFHDKTKLLYCTQVDAFFEIWQFDLVNNQTQFIYAVRNKPTRLALAPNDQSVILFEKNNLYLLNLVTKDNLRLHEGAQFANWSPTSKQIVFTTTDGRLLLQQLSVNPKLDKPLVLLNEIANVPVFIDERTIAYEGIIDDQYTIFSLDLTTLQSKPITSLRFTTNQPALDLQLEPNQERFLYVRPDETSSIPAVWIFHRNKDVPKLILTNAYHVIWSNETNVLYYTAITDNSNSIWRSTVSGLNKTKLIDNASAVVTSLQNISNDTNLLL